MGIIEAAKILRDIAKQIAKDRGITEQEAWLEALEVFKREYRVW
ncbi:Uncharacterised protein [[Clostridium] sordellii]|uniref:Uncharacterized protein n=1 Tax=Paraclostridium sordellii TaxID=1505 RepID=A0A9P1L1Q0_PARSO|nr:MULTISPECIES: hypothetical protein [Paeniclostridium]DAK99033.1 MAG TPA: hypothetical protein [Caudoviricetes sp.]MCQ4696535.1 hypothetical protein [Paeniclostridium sordellii]MDU2148234.1 hypothetical protein [Paeniclostridium sordellii]MDU2686739.1 hypothetical protein [Paeniclostridium sordellii]MDU4413037.1 hypothetical protein [Paeniclostridium sordellii]